MHTHIAKQPHSSRRWGNWGDNQIHLSCPPPLPFPPPRWKLSTSVRTIDWRHKRLVAGSRWGQTARGCLRCQGRDWAGDERSGGAPGDGSWGGRCEQCDVLISQKICFSELGAAADLVGVCSPSWTDGVSVTTSVWCFEWVYVERWWTDNVLPVAGNLLKFQFNSDQINELKQRGSRSSQKQLPPQIVN